MSHLRMKAMFAMVSAVALSLPMLASASTSRVEGMALQGDYIKDETGIFTYTNEVANVGNLIYGELGNWVGPSGDPLDRAMGAVLGNLGEGRWGAWGIHMRQFTPQLGQGDVTSQPNPSQVGGDPNFNQWESFDLQWAKKFGNKSLGLGINRSYGKLEGDNGALGNISELKFDFTGFDPNLARNIMGLSAGLGWDLSPASTLELAAKWQSRTFLVRDTLGNETKDDGPTTWQFAARMFHQAQPNLMIVPVFKYSSYDLSTKNPTLSFNNSWTSWQLGAAGNWTLGSNDLFVLGVTFAQNKLEQEEDVAGVGADNATITETYMPQIFGALETHVNNWLTLRFGANKGVSHSIKIEDHDTPQSLRQSDSPFSMELGAGVKVGTLQLDGVLNSHIAQNGLYFISGSANAPLASKVTATYAF